MVVVILFSLCNAFACALLSLWLFNPSTLTKWLHGLKISSAKKRTVALKHVKALAEQHEVAAVLADMVHKDGAGSWPPRANHNHVTWPAPLQPYKEIYLELAARLPQATASLDDQVNFERIVDFRRRFRELLSERVNLQDVKQVSNVMSLEDDHTLTLSLSSSKPRMQANGTSSLEMYTTLSTAASPPADMHIVGQPYQSFKLLSSKRRLTCRLS